MPKLFNIGTNKRGLIVYGGESSADFGMVIGEAPAYDKATRKTTTYSVPGRNGDIVIQEDAWSDVPHSYKVWVAKDHDDLTDLVNAFTAWLNSIKGYQRLEDSFEPETFRLAYYNGGQSVSNELTQYGETTIQFICRAERFYKSGEQPITVSNGDKLFNFTRFASKPLIHIEGSGTVTVTIGDKTITAAVTDYINIDCDRQNAYRLPTENKNTDISGTFPTIEPGESAVATTGTITKLEITPRYFTI